jgi:hypothetical protein
MYSWSTTTSAFRRADRLALATFRADRDFVVASGFAASFRSLAARQRTSAKAD